MIEVVVTKKPYIWQKWKKINNKITKNHEASTKNIIFKNFWFEKYNIVKKEPQIKKIFKIWCVISIRNSITDILLYRKYAENPIKIKNRQISKISIKCKRMFNLLLFGLMVNKLLFLINLSYSKKKIKFNDENEIIERKQLEIKSVNISAVGVIVGSIVKLNMFKSKIDIK